LNKHFKALEQQIVNILLELVFLVECKDAGLLLRALNLKEVNNNNNNNNNNF